MSTAIATVYVETESDFKLRNFFLYLEAGGNDTIKGMFLLGKETASDAYNRYIERKRMHKSFNRISNILEGIKTVEITNTPDDDLAQIGYRLSKHVIKSEWDAFRKAYAKDIKKHGLEEKVKKVNESYSLLNVLHGIFGY
jgi:hypothetical protein